MRSEVKKAHLNLSINPEYAKLFSDLESIHGMTLSGFLELKLKELFQEKAPDELMELEIIEMRARLVELESTLPRVKSTYKNLRELQKRNNAKKDDEVQSDDKWIERFDAYQKSNVTMVNRRDQDFFKKVASDWGFKSALEADEKLTNYVKSLGMYGCKVCKKWRAKNQVCSLQNRITDDQFSCRSWEKR